MAKPKKALARRKPVSTSKAGVSQAWLGKHLDVAQQRVAQFVKDGTFVPLPDGKLDPDDCRVRYIRWLRDESRKSSASQAQSRVQDARAREIELRIGRDEGSLIDLEDVEVAIAEVVGAFSAELAGIPASCTRDLELRRAIEKKLNGAIDRCRKRFEEAKSTRFDSGESAVEEEAAAA